MKCSACNNKMATIKEPDIEYEECKNCGGNFFLNDSTFIRNVQIILK